MEDGEAMEYKNLSVEQRDGIIRLAVNRPEVLNALNRETLRELLDFFYRVEEEPSARAVLVTGAGEKAFVAGADIAEMAAMKPEEAKKFSDEGQHLFNLIENLGKPVAAAVNGFALGGGLEFAMACSFRYASEKARMGQPEINLGLIPGFGGTQRLPRLVGWGPALELLLTGEMIDAGEALRLGLVNRVLPPGSLLEETGKTLRKIAEKSPIMVEYIQQSVNKGLSMTLKDGLALEANLFSMCFGTEDMREGTEAFLNKRKPSFKGR